MCKLIPRSAWTAYPAKGNTGNDDIDGLPNFRSDELLGTCVHFTGTDRNYQELDPAVEFEKIRRVDMGSKGYGDIMYNLGVAGNVEGVWTLRGTTNKGAANGSATVNAQYVSVFCLLGRYEQPTDLMLENLRNARKVILYSWPNAQGIVGHDQVRPGGTECPGMFLIPIIHTPGFWDQVNPEPPAPVPFVCELPPAPLSEGTKNVHVQDLQNQLAFWGYYTARADGDYGPITRHAVRLLQADLSAAGKYRKEIDGQYGRYTRDGWCALLKDLWEMSH
jgi:hypothetical protein